MTECKQRLNVNSSRFIKQFENKYLKGWQGFSTPVLGIHHIAKVQIFHAPNTTDAAQKWRLISLLRFRTGLRFQLIKYDII